MAGRSTCSQVTERFTCSQPASQLRLRMPLHAANWPLHACIVSPTPQLTPQAANISSLRRALTTTIFVALQHSHSHDPRTANGARSLNHKFHTFAAAAARTCFLSSMTRLQRSSV